MKNEYLYVFDYSIPGIFEYVVPIDDFDVEQFLYEHGHNDSSCEWMTSGRQLDIIRDGKDYE